MCYVFNSFLEGFSEKKSRNRNYIVLAFISVLLIVVSISKGVIISPLPV